MLMRWRTRYCARPRARRRPPGTDTIDLTVEKNVLNVTATRQRATRCSSR